MRFPDRHLAAPALLAGSVALLGAASAPLGPRQITVLDEASRGGPPSETGAGVDLGCPAGTLPDGDICVHLPGEDDPIDPPIAANMHRERSGRWAQYDQIPRRPDRPADYDLYRYPIPPGLPGGH